LVHLSFALNFWLFKGNLVSFHIFNLIIHILATLIVFGIIRRILLLSERNSFFGEQSFLWAVFLSLLWMTHPIQTQSVSYISQRMESMVGLFYLATFYGMIRYVTEPTHRRRWFCWSVLSCGLGMMTKEIMVTCPILVFIGDRLLFAKSFKEIIQKRLGFYLGLAATWGILGALLFFNYPSVQNAGFHFEEVKPWQYALTQFGVIIHYLKLVVWPYPLVLDYQWPIVEDIKEAVFPGLMITILFTATIWAMYRYPKLGFLGLSFFLILAPTSSVMPIKDPAMEHRLYLPLLPILILLVIMLNYLIGRIIHAKKLKFYTVSGTLICLIAVYSYMTYMRNQDYRDEATMWQDVMTKQPLNYRAFNNYATFLKKQGRLEEALQYYQKALEINPKYFYPYLSIGTIFNQIGRQEEAATYFNQLLKFQFKSAKTNFEIGNWLSDIGRFDEAAIFYERAIHMKPNYLDAHYNLANTFLYKEDAQKAFEYYEKVLSIDSRHAGALTNLATIFASNGNFQQARELYIQSIESDPLNTDAYNNLGNIFAIEQNWELAIKYYQKALELNPNFTEARSALNHVLAMQNK